MPKTSSGNLRIPCNILRRAVVSLLFAAAAPTGIFLLASRQTPALAAGASTLPATAPTTRPERFTFNFKDVPLDSVLNYFSQEIGFEVLRDGDVDAHVTMMSRQPLSRQQAIEMLDAALQANGFAVRQEGNLLHIATSARARHGNVAVHFGANAADVADSNELITQIIPIGNVNAVKLRDDLKPLVAPDADLAANEGSNSIIVTDVSSRVRHLVEIISQLDQHEAATSELRIYSLKHANATAAAKLIDALFKPGARMPLPGVPQQQPQPQPESAPGAVSERHGEVVTAADERTNTLLVMASADAQKSIEDVLKHIDEENPNPVPMAELQAFPLKFAQAASTAKLINDVFNVPKNPFEQIYIVQQMPLEKESKVTAVADERTNTVVISGPTEKLKEIESLIHQLDASPMAPRDLRVIRLKYADAFDISELVQNMFQPKEGTSNTPQLPFFYFNPQGRERPPRDYQVTVDSDTRTNSVLIAAPTELLDGIEKIVRQLDADPTSQDTMFIYHLRNAQASHLEYTLNVLFGNVSGAQANQPNQQQPGNANPQNPNNAQGAQNQGLFSNSSSITATGNVSAHNQSNRQTNNRNQRSSLGTAPNSGQATNELTGNVLVVAEPDSNSLLVTTATKYEQQVKAIIAELDRPVPQVLIKCLVAEVTHDKELDYGTDFSVLNIRASGNGTSVGSTLGAADAALSSASPPGVVAKIVETNVMATLQALAQINKLNVLSRPYILTSDNQEADITVGDEVPFVTGSFTDTLGGIHNTIEYQDIGIVLDVTPHINPDGLVVMDVNPQISSLTGQTVTIQQGVAAPLFELRSASCRVAIRDGQTIVIGGLMQDQKTVHENKVPILGDIPLLGALFKYSTKDKSKTELLIFLTPHVIPQSANMENISSEELRNTQLAPHAVDNGVLQGHLRGMHLGPTPQTQPATDISPIKSIDLNTPPATQPRP